MSPSSLDENLFNFNMYRLEFTEVMPKYPFADGPNSAVNLFPSQ